MGPLQGRVSIVLAVLLITLRPVNKYIADTEEEENRIKRKIEKERERAHYAGICRISAFPIIHVLYVL